MTKRVTIESWIALHYSGECAPSILTVRRWIREGRIYPLPEKHGRTYYLSPTARYLVDNQSRMVA